MAKQTILLSGSDWQFKGYVGEDWLWRAAHKPGTRDVRGWQRGTVPGAVQNDLWQAGTIPDPYQERNSLLIEWVPERTWLYKKTFNIPEHLRGQHARLVFDGVDYSAHYFLNGEDIGSSTGMYLPAAFDVTDRLVYGGDNLLTVVIEPAPFEQPQVGYTSKVYTQKARMNYWWDFCPRMVHIGIWQDVRLEFSGLARVADLRVVTELAANGQSSEVVLTAALEGLEDGTDVVVELAIFPEKDSNNRMVLTRSLARRKTMVEAKFMLKQPALWWPNGAGEQPLYGATAKVSVGGQLSDQVSTNFGVRKIEFLPNENAPAGALPYTLTVNGRRLYINGWNWVPMDVLYGMEQPEKRERLLRLARSAGVNLLRVWGGGLIEKEAFYDQCDRQGILVWQEFIQSSSGIDNIPSSDPKFIAFLIHNAEVSIRARRNHPSLAIWCGGNELHTSQHELCDENYPALAALRETVRRLDPARMWLPTSPSGKEFGFGSPGQPVDPALKHDVHGPWEYQGLKKHYDLYNNSTSLLHSEFGVEGITNLRTLNATIPADTQWPVSLDNPLWDHLAAWWVKEKVWHECFGEFADLLSAQRGTQFLQAEGLRYALEADRRRQFHNAGTLPWQFNEPYPMAGCTSAVDYFAEPKPVYYTVARAYRPLTLTAKLDTLAWAGESKFRAEVWCSNAGAGLGGRLTARLINELGMDLAEQSAEVTCPENGSKSLLAVQMPLNKVTGDLFFLDLRLEDRSGKLLAENRYLFTTSETLAPILNQPPAQVEMQVEKAGDAWMVTVSNELDQPALGLWLEAEKPDLRALAYTYFSDNYFHLLPGEAKTVRVEWVNVPEERRKITVSGWNLE